MVPPVDKSARGELKGFFVFDLVSCFLFHIPFLSPRFLLREKVMLWYILFTDGVLRQSGIKAWKGSPRV
jgi:hypothetical protein